MSVVSESDGQRVRRSNRIPLRSTKALVKADEDEISDDEVKSDSTFSPDVDEASIESFQDSDWSKDEYNKPKKRKKSFKSLQKRKKPVKKTQQQNVYESSRRSTRVKSQPDYCEDSSDEDIYELCDGQPLKLISNKLHNQVFKGSTQRSTLKSVSPLRKKTKISHRINSSNSIVSPHPLFHVTSEALRDVRQTRSQVSYLEESSDDSYELCDGQPKKSANHSKCLLYSPDLNKAQLNDNNEVLLNSKNSLQSGFNDVTLEDEVSSSNKVVLVKGQPTLLSKAITMYANDNIFVVHKEYLKESHYNQPLCIWKLHGKLMQKFVQVDASKVFESTSNYLANDIDDQELYKPIKAIVFDKKQDRYLSELLDCPENQTLLNAIKNHAKLIAGSQLSSICESTSERSSKDIIVPKVEKRGRKRKDRASEALSGANSLRDNMSRKTNKKRGRPRKSTTSTSTKTASSAISIEEILPVIRNLDISAFTTYFQFLLMVRNDDQYLKKLSESKPSIVTSISNSLSILAEKLLNKTKLDSVLLADLENFPLVREESISEEIPDIRVDLSPPVDKRLILSGKNYDRHTLIDVIESQDSTKKFLLPTKDVEICRAYHNLRHFDKHLMESYWENIADSGSVNCKHERIRDEVEQTLESVLQQVGDETIDVVATDVRRTLDKVVEQVVATRHFRDTNVLFNIEKVPDEEWLKQMLHSLKAAANAAYQLVSFDGGA